MKNKKKTTDQRTTQLFNYILMFIGKKVLIDNFD